METSLSPNTVRVGFGLRPGDPFWVQVREAVQQRAQELGVTLVPITLPADHSTGEAHLAVIEELKAQELGALISHVISEAFLQAVLNEGIAVVCSEDNAVVHPLLVSVQGLMDAAVLAAEFAVEALGGQGEVLIVGALADASLTGQCRIDGLQRVLARYPALHWVRAGSLWRYDETYDELLAEAEAWTAAVGGRRIDAILGLSDSLALAGRDACQALGLAGDRMIVVGINGDPLAIAAIEAGTMHATVETNAQALGFNLAEFGRQAALRAPLPDYFPYALQLVTRANVSQVAARKLVAIAEIPSRLVDVNFRLERQRMVQMKASLELNQRVGSILDQDELLEVMSEIIRTRYDYDRVQFFFWSHTDRALVPAQVRSAPEGQGAIPLAASGALGHALLHNQVLYIPDAANSKRFLPDPRWPAMRSRVILPVRLGGRILGLLDLHSARRTLRNQAELDALQTLADELGTAMRNAQLYAQAVQARAEAVQAGLLRSRLLANVSHQLRTPLNVILGYCQAALANADAYPAQLPDELVQDLRTIERSGVDLQRLINDLLDLAQAETGTLHLFPEVIATRPFLEEIFVAAQPLLARGGDVRWKLQLPIFLPELVADSVRLRNTLMNLLDNAAKYTHHGQIVLGADASDRQLHIWVQDTGPGMPADVMAQLRQELVLGSSTPSARGTDKPQPGLGLAISQHLIAQHGGDFQVESVQGRGSTCHIFLPLHLPAPEVEGGAPHEQGGVSWPGLSAEQLVKKTHEYIAAHYATPFTREELAQALGVSPSYVTRIFRRRTGLALWDYVNHFRVARACDLLEHSDMTVTEIAFAVGFNDPAYFSRVFRNERGKAPTRYRMATS